MSKLVPLFRGKITQCNAAAARLLGHDIEATANLNNAMKFMPKGGRITIHAHATGENVVVEVRDTGQGIDESEQKRLFQPYNRIEADRQHFSGLGLGLALCKKLIELHHGQIWCNSQKGSGSTFGFSVAIYQEPSPSAPPNQSVPVRGD